MNEKYMNIAILFMAGIALGLILPVGVVGAKVPGVEWIGVYENVSAYAYTLSSGKPQVADMLLQN